MPELLLELRSEEIPARMQAKAGEDLKAGVVDALKSAGADAEDAAAFAGPRRLTVTVQGLPIRTADVREVRKGPRTDAPEKAIDGFLKSVGLSSVDECEVKEDKKGAFLTAVKIVPGRPVGELIADALPDVLAKFPWPKSMRSGHGDLRWVRPLRSILCVFDEEVVEVEVGGLKARDLTVGHRALSPEPVRATTFDAYDAALRKAHVMLRAEERAETILHEATTLAQAQGLALVADDGLLKEAAGLVEWPFPRIGSFDQAFLALPDEVILTVLKNHQKCFALKDPKTGRLAAKFIYVANQEGADGGAAIRAGNERVVRARLNDARFFWDQDRKTTLESRVERLKDIVFQAKLGTVAQKTRRVAALARHLAQFSGAKPDDAHRAAVLAKADLVTEMVGEFPELQGLVGGWYAEADGEPGPVATAVRDHYKPLGPSDAVPSEPVAIAVALADKLDTLAGFWAIDEKPTGSKDPFALRRAALGVIRLILENDVRLGLLQAVAPGFVILAKQFDSTAMKAVMAQLDKLTKDARANRFATRLAKLDVQFGASAGDQAAARKLFETRAVELLAFFADRLKVALKDKGVRHDVIDAVFALGEDDMVLIVKRAEALQSFITTEDGAALLAAYNRAANILRIEEKKDGHAYDGAVDAPLLQETAETSLVKALDEAQPAAKAAVEREDYEAAMRALSSLRAPVDAFFDKVTVNAEDPAVRANRLNLLNRIRAAVDAVADFSQIGSSV